MGEEDEDTYGYDHDGVRMSHNYRIEYYSHNFQRWVVYRSFMTEDTAKEVYAKVCEQYPSMSIRVLKHEWVEVQNND